LASKANSHHDPQIGELTTRLRHDSVALRSDCHFHCVSRCSTIMAWQVRIHFNPSKLPLLEGAVIMFSYNPRPPNNNGLVGFSWTHSPFSERCGIVNSSSPGFSTHPWGNPSTHEFLDIVCAFPMVGRYLYLYQPRPVCFEVLEIEATGVRDGCTECDFGKYEDHAGSTACKTCPWAWDTTGNSLRLFDSSEVGAKRVCLAP